MDTPTNKPWEFRVDRTSVLGNPYMLNFEEDRDAVCDGYKTWFIEQMERADFMEALYNILTALKAYSNVFHNIRFYFFICPIQYIIVQHFFRWM